ncbi:DUF262 domain-containing protein [Corynebacterium hindlerae]|uniref:DUF262 domain-containing protein n=1 Tax=Corynebacterium hindlerae TaxID=699041 RepID=UPI001AD61D76|nr:DUF262 domain-containing protein [Corynebacterium hindlerae]QTH59879.1 DUF262 domain-containing protein [Corynebacterium hindlerae]
MSKLNIDQKTVRDLFSDKRSDFLIPDYQRPYSWGQDECATLWEDIFQFAIPNDNAEEFDSNDEYFLGPIVTFKNSNGKLEIIDGQQRLTTLMLLLRAFYAKFEHMKDENSKKTYEAIGQCIWKTDEFGNPDKDRLKLDSEVASDDDKDEFLEILRTGTVSATQKSRYAKAFVYFFERIENFISQYPSYTAHLATRILNNVILLPIEAESQRTALRIFSTLNDRGLPLADSDIFKSQMYRYFDENQQKDQFIKRWKELERLVEHTFSDARNAPMDELFTRYMYFERARKGIKTTTTEGLRDFVEADSYALLKRSEALKNLEELAKFWGRVADQEGFSDRVLRQLFILNYAPNNMWANLVSVYFLHNHDENGALEEEKFFNLLRRIIGFIWAYSVYRPGVNALRTPVYPEMIRIVAGEEVTFASYRFDRQQIEKFLRNYAFTNGRPITKSVLTWWAFTNADQEIWPLDTKLEVEHVYARRRANHENSLKELASLEELGNKAILEKRINIRASDYKFSDKKKYYTGFTPVNGRHREATKNRELVHFAEGRDDFTESDIKERTDRMVSAFIGYLEEQELLRN